MPSLLEHSDHRKAGRALAIVSVSYILLGQCSAGFDTAGILGLNIQITQEDLHRIFGYLRWVYLVIFLIRIMPNLGIDRLYKFQADRDEQLDDTWTALKRVANEKHRKGMMSAADWRKIKHEYYSRKLKFVGYSDFILLYVTEFLPPLIFFTATWVNLQPYVCPGFIVLR